MSPRDYLASSDQTFWKWSDDNDVVVWKEGTTIAFRAMLMELVRHRSDRGLPPFDHLLLVVSACRDSWDEWSPQGIAPSRENNWLPETLPLRGDLWEQLSELNKMPSELRTGLKAINLLLDVVFEETEAVLPPSECKSLLTALQSRMFTKFLRHRDDPGPEANRQTQRAHQLLEGLKRLSAAALKLRQATGIEQEVKPAPLELPPVLLARSVIDQLLNDRELAGLGRLTRHLLAAMTFLRPLTEQEELPIGGVSDITNRGPLDRLLLSELAHDDLTLATRIATGEALYLRREPPHNNPHGARRLLIDVGLRQWGTPRLFATAAALAVSAHDPKVLATAYSARGDQVVPADLNSAQGVTGLLERIGIDLHPGEALAAFFNAEINARKAASELEPMIVTHQEVLNDDDFQVALRTAMATANIPAALVAAVTRHGELTVEAVLPHGIKRVKKLQLDLEEILYPPKSRSLPLLDPNAELSLPAIYRLKRFPLRLPFLCRPGSFARLNADLVVGTTNNRELVLWDGQYRTGELLAARIPHGEILWGELLDDETAAVVVGTRSTGVLAIARIDLPSHQVEWTNCVERYRDPKEVLRLGEYLVVILQNGDVNLVRLATGEHHRQQTFPFHHLNGPYFRDHQSRKAIHQLIITGDILHLDPTPIAALQRCEAQRVLDIATPNANDPESLPQRYGLATSKVFDLRNESEVMVISSEAALADAVVAKDNLTFVAMSHNRKARYRIDIAKRQWNNVNTELSSLALAEGLYWLERPIVNLPHKFKGIAAKEGELYFLSQRGVKFVLSLSPGDGILHMDIADPNALPQDEFHQWTSEKRDLRTFALLRTVTYPNGDEVVFDNRGMVSFKSSSQGLPEMTLLLKMRSSDFGGVTGWCANGMIWGDDSFTGRKSNATYQEAFDEVVLPWIRSLQ